MACVAGPFVLLAFVGPVWAACVGVVLALSWLLVMPTTCFDGGLLWSFLGMNMLALLCGWTLLGLRLLVQTIL